MKKEVIFYIVVGVIVLIIVYLIINKFSNMFGKSEEEKTNVKTTLEQQKKWYFIPNAYKSRKDLTLLFKEGNTPYTIGKIFKEKVNTPHALAYNLSLAIKGVGTNTSLFFDTLSKIKSLGQLNQVVTYYSIKYNSSLIDDVINDLSTEELTRFYNYVSSLKL